MSFLLSIESMRQAYSIYKFSTNFISKTESVIEEIGANELKAALNSIHDMHISNKPERELNMAITQLRSALQNFDSNADNFLVSHKLLEKRWKTSLLISICYHILDENDLCLKYHDKTYEDFSDWLENISQVPVGKIYAKEHNYNVVKQKINSIGLQWNYSHPESHGIFPDLVRENHRRLDEAFFNHKENIKDQYKDVIERLTR